MLEGAPLSRRRTWEHLGRGSAPRELFFLSEGGHQAVHKAWALVASSLLLVSPQHCSLPRLQPVPVETLGQHLGYLMAGIPSLSFPFCQHSSSFSLLPGLCLPSLSPEAVTSLASPFLRVGGQVRKLEALCCSRHHSGSIWGGFQAGLRSFLRLYVTSTVTVSGRLASNLSALEQALRPLAATIQFLAAVCFPPDCPALPSGVSLLSRLLDVSVHVSNPQVHLVLVSLLRAAAAPYFAFLQAWLFSGEVESLRPEFGLSVDPRHLGARDVGYWRHAFSLLPLQGSDFLADIQVQVHRAGKSLALLRKICPEHYLAGRFRDRQPVMGLAVTAQEQVELRAECAEYERCMREVAREETVTLAEKVRQEVEVRAARCRDLQERHKEAREERMRQVAKEQEEKVARQAVLREELRLQAEEVRERRAREREAVLEEDQRVERERERMEEVAMAREEEDRARMEGFYARLTAEAEERERRAEWRMRRQQPGLVARRSLLHAHMEEGLRKLLLDVQETSSGEEDSVFPDLRFQTDELGNMTVTVEGGLWGAK